MLRKLLKRHKRAEPDPPVFVTGVGRDREIRIGCPVDVYELTGVKLLSGKITDINKKMFVVQLDLDHVRSELQTYRGSVYIRGLDLGHQTFCLSGEIYFLQDRHFCIEHLVIQSNKDLRETDRLFVLHPCKLYQVTPDLNTILREDPCFLVDASVGGACIESQTEYPLDTFVRLYIQFPECKSFGVYGRIVRVTPVQNFGLSVYRYGVSFILNDHTEAEKLSHNLNQIKIVSRKLKL